MIALKFENLTQLRCVLNGLRKNLTIKGRIMQKRLIYNCQLGWSLICAFMKAKAGMDAADSRANLHSGRFKRRSLATLCEGRFPRTKIKSCNTCRDREKWRS